MTDRSDSRGRTGRGRAPTERSNGAETRERIIQAATTQLRMAGYEGTTVSAIARASGVTTPALYWHFPSKEEIAFACIERVYDEMYEALRAANQGPTAAERLSSVVAEWVRTVLADPDLATGLSSHQLLGALSEEHRQVLRNKDKEYQGLILGILSDGVAEGCFQVRDPLITANVIITACDYAFVWLRPGRKRSIGYITQRYGELMVALASNGSTEA